MNHNRIEHSPVNAMEDWEQAWIIEGVGFDAPPGFVYSPLPSHLRPPPTHGYECGCESCRECETPINEHYEPPQPPAFDPQHSGCYGSERVSIIQDGRDAILLSALFGFSIATWAAIIYALVKLAR